MPPLETGSWENLIRSEPWKCTIRNCLKRGYIGGVEIRNRVAMTAMGNGLASWDGEASPELIRFYEDRARGGCGLIFTEFTRVDETSGACNPNQLCIATRKHVRSVQRMAERVHRHGARIFVQLHHGGREAPPALNDGKQPYGSQRHPQQGKRTGLYRDDQRGDRLHHQKICGSGSQLPEGRDRRCRTPRRPWISAGLLYQPLYQQANGRIWRQRPKLLPHRDRDHQRYSSCLRQISHLCADQRQRLCGGRHYPGLCRRSGEKRWRLPVRMHSTSAVLSMRQCPT